MSTEKEQRVHDCIFGEIDLSMDLWRRHPNPACAGEAAEILAAWAHGHRLRKRSDPAWNRLDDLVGREFAALCAAAEQDGDPEAWREDFVALHGNSEDILSDGDLEVCADAALDLFSRLDQAQLAAWAMQRLKAARAAAQYRKWIVCDRLLRDNLVDFLPIHTYVRALSEQYRDDLAEFDADLAFVTNKYPLILRKYGEASLDAAPSPAVRETLAEIFPGFRASLPGHVIRFFDSAALCMAAGTEDDAVALTMFGMRNEWQAHAHSAGDINDGMISFHVMLDGLPCSDGALSVGTLAADVKKGKAVFQFDAFRKAAEAGGAPVLEVDGNVMPGVWENE